MAKASFESMLTELDRLIAELEQGELPLEQLLKRYQSGVKLLAACQERLDGAQTRLQELAPQQEAEE